MTLEEFPLGLTHQRMHNGFEAAERNRVAENAPAEFAAVNRPAFGDAGKFGLDRRHRAAAGAKQSVHGRIGVVHGDTQTAQHRRRRAFTHADRAGETEYFHGGCLLARR